MPLAHRSGIVKKTVNLPRKSMNLAVRYQVKDEDKIGTVFGNSHSHRPAMRSGQSSGPMLVKMAKRGQNVARTACRLEDVDDIAAMHTPLGQTVSGAAARR